MVKIPEVPNPEPTSSACPTPLTTMYITDPQTTDPPIYLADLSVVDHIKLNTLIPLPQTDRHKN